MNMIRMIAAAVVAAGLCLAALADTCPDCGSETTDSGRCPYCQPKPELSP